MHERNEPLGNEAKTLRNKIYPLIFNSFPPNHPRQGLPLLQWLLVLASTTYAAKSQDSPQSCGKRKGVGLKDPATFSLCNPGMRLPCYHTAAAAAVKDQAGRKA